MSSEFEQIENTALNLEKKERILLADKLLRSIHGEIDPHIDQAWIEEINRRKQEVEAKEVSLMKVGEVLSKARKLLQK